MQKAIAFLLFLTAWAYSCLAQEVTDTLTPQPDTLRILEILYADKQGYKRVDTATELQFLVGNVQVKQGKTYFYCDSAVFNRKLYMLEAFGKVHINDADSVQVYGQYLKYFTNTRMANLKKKVKLTDSQSSLYTDEMTYDVNQKIGEYLKGGRIENGKSILTSEQATYYSDLKDAFFKKKVHLKNPEYSLDTDSLLYNTESEVATFITYTVVTDSSNRKIKTRDGYYDKKNKKAVFKQRPVIEDGAVTVTADDINTNDSTGINILTGNAVYKDTAQKMAVIANLIEANRNTDQFRATQKPLMIFQQENDTLYLAADTLYSARLSSLIRDSASADHKIADSLAKESTGKTKDSTDRYFTAYSHVKIFSDSLQALSDSLFYSFKDSTFRLFKSPVFWSAENQVTGDTILLFTRNNKADRLLVNENALLINKDGTELFNQIEGHVINGSFSDGIIDYIRAKGTASSIYYIKDQDSSMVGVNKASGDIIDLRFVNKELKRVLYINDVKGKMYPFKEFPDAEKQLRNFQWLEAKRPKDKFALLED
jgi:lipopolysaccharide export system protein LptA